MTTATPLSRLALPMHGAKNPGATPATTPGSFALAPDVGGPFMFASPDTPGMPAPPPKTALDFLPEGWSVETLSNSESQAPTPESRILNLESQIPNPPSPSHRLTVSPTHSSSTFTT